MTRPKIGLALGSGSARGWAHIGILDQLQESGIEPDIVTGASVGALVAAAHASGQLDALEAWVCQLTKVDIWRLVDTTLRGGGVMRGNRLMRAIAERIEDRAIEDLPTAFAAVAADLETGQEVWIREGPMLSAVRASSGLPGLFSPMWYQDRWLIDGGVVNPVPVSLCRALGADYVIAVNLNTHLSKHAGLLRRRALARAAALPDEEPPTESSSDSEDPSGRTRLEKWSELVDGLVGAVKSSKPAEPGLFEVMATSINIMQDLITRSRMVGDPPAILITPDLGHFQMMDFHRAAEAIELGRAAVEKVADEIEELNKLIG
jgi:NTE family protein